MRFNAAGSRVARSAAILISLVLAAFITGHVRAQGTGSYSYLSVTGTLDVFGSTTLYGEWTGDNAVPGAVFSYSDGSSGTNAWYLQTLTRAKAGWVWQRSSNSYNTMELDGSNRLTLTSTAGNNSIVLDPNLGAVTLVNASGSSSILFNPGSGLESFVDPLAVGLGGSNDLAHFGAGAWVNGPDSLSELGSSGQCNLMAITSQDSYATTGNYPLGVVIKLIPDDFGNIEPTILGNHLGVGAVPLVLNTDEWGGPQPGPVLVGTYDWDGQSTLLVDGLASFGGPVSAAGGNVYLDSSGDGYFGGSVGIDTSNPQAALEVNGGAQFDAGAVVTGSAMTTGSTTTIVASNGNYLLVPRQGDLAMGPFTNGPQPPTQTGGGYSNDDGQFGQGMGQFGGVGSSGTGGD
jgi:hypothetical protein